MPTLTPEEMLLAVLDNAPVYLAVLEGPELRCTRMNALLHELTAHMDVIGRTAEEIHGEGTVALTVMRRVYASGEPETITEMPVPVLGPGQQTRYFTRTYTPLRDASRTIRGVMVSGYEVTDAVRERAANEERVQRSQAERARWFALLEEAPVGLALLEAPDWQLAMANRRMRETLGEQAVAAMTLRNLLPADSPTIARLERVLATGQAETFEAVSQLEGYVGRAFHMHFVPIRSADGAIGAVMAAGNEISEERRVRKALETHAHELEVARAAAVDAGRAKDQFLAMLGHELRNPLQPMLTAVQVMRLDGVSSLELDMLEREVQHMIRLVDDLLDISRITRGMVILEHEALDVDAIVYHALQISGPLLESRGHIVSRDIQLEGLGVSGDPQRLAQVVSNLIQNAAKYSDPGSEIRITARPANDRVVLEISDDGAGIAPDMVDRVFDAFVKQPQTLARASGGLGLGLAIVKSYVEAHGGSVSIHSEGLGHGSTFVVELPAIAVDREASNGHIETNPRTSTPLRILVVDDNVVAADLIKSGLEALGHDITVAHDGPSALEIATTQHPDIALLDIGLPVMDGYRLGELLRDAYNIPIIAITGYEQDVDRERSRDAGFAAHLVKPIDLDELGELIADIA